MARRVCAALVCLLMADCALAFPVGEDSAQVESITHEVRVGSRALFDLEGAATNHGSKYDHGGDSNDDIGYLRTHSSKGNDGYQHFDSFHKKDGDKYGVETHSAYGKAEDAGEYGGSHHDKGSYSEEDAGSDDGYGEGTTVNEHYSRADDDDDRSEDFDDRRGRAKGNKQARQGAGTTVKEHYSQAKDDGEEDLDKQGTGEYSDDDGGDHYSGGGGGEFYGGGGSGEHSSGGGGSYHGGGGGSSYHGGGGGGGSYHGGGASHSEGGGGGEGGGDKSYYTEYSKGDKDNGSHGNSYGDSSSYGDEYHD